MQLSIIAAVGRNNELGKNNDLIWHFKDDMKFFRETTMGHTMIMGRKTFESLPKMLPGRKHLVLSRSGLLFPPEVDVYQSVDQFLETYENVDDEIFDIGGATMYDQLLPYANNLYLTEIDAEDNEATVFFPEFDQDDFTRKELSAHVDEKTGISYSHTLYKRRVYGKR